MNISYILVVCGLFITLYSLVMTICSSALGWSIETGMLLFYLLAACGHLLPMLPGKDYQSSFYKLLKVVLFPQNSITFPELLLADALCSISKLLKDFGTTAVTIYAYFRRENIILYHDSAMILVALLASLPFW